MLSPCIVISIVENTCVVDTHAHSVNVLVSGIHTFLLIFNFLYSFSVFQTQLPALKSWEGPLSRWLFYLSIKAIQQRKA